MFKFDISKLDLNNPFDPRGVQEVGTNTEGRELDIFTSAKNTKTSEEKEVSKSTQLNDVLENDIAENFEYEYDLDAIEEALNNGGIVPEYDEYNLKDNKIKSTDSVATAQKKIAKQENTVNELQIQEEKGKSAQEVAKNAEEMAKDAEERAKEIEEESNTDEIDTDKETLDNEVNADKLVSEVGQNQNPMIQQMQAQMPDMNAMLQMQGMNQGMDVMSQSMGAQDDSLANVDYESMSKEELLELQGTYNTNIESIEKFDAENPMPQVNLPSSLQTQSNAISSAKSDITTQTNEEETEKVNNAAAKADVTDKKDTASQKQGALQDASKVVQDISKAITPLQAATKMMFAQANSVIASGEGVIATGEATVGTGQATVSAGKAALAAAQAAVPVSSAAVAAAKATIASGEAQIAAGESAIASGEATVTSGEAMLANAESMEQAVNGLQQGLKQANTVLKIAQGDFNFAELAVNTALDTLGASDTKLGEVVRAVQDAKNKYDQCVTIYNTAKAVATGNYEQALMGIGSALDSFDKLQNGTPQKEGVSTDFGKNLENNFNDKYWKLTDDEKFDGQKGLSGNYMKDMLTSGAEMAGALGAKKLGAGMLAFNSVNNLASGGGKFGQNMKDIAAIASFAGNDKIAMTAGLAGTGANLASGEGTFSQNMKDISDIASLSGNDKIANWGKAFASAADGVENYNNTTAARASLRKQGISNPTDKQLSSEIQKVKQEQENKNKSGNNNIENSQTRDAKTSLKAKGIKNPTDKQIKDEITNMSNAKNSLSQQGNTTPSAIDIHREMTSQKYENEAIASLKKQGNNNPTKEQIAIEIAFNISKK